MNPDEFASYLLSLVPLSKNDSSEANKVYKNFRMFRTDGQIATDIIRSASASLCPPLEAQKDKKVYVDDNNRRILYLVSAMTLQLDQWSFPRWWCVDVAPDLVCRVLCELEESFEKENLVSGSFCCV